MILADPLTCMAVALYFEARSELPIHQAMVAATINNRVISPRYPDTVCGVVKQKHQFSFFWDGLPEVITEYKAWTDSVLMAVWSLQTEVVLTNACHYATNEIANHWTRSYKGTVHGNHTFYTGGC